MTARQENSYSENEHRLLTNLQSSDQKLFQESWHAFYDKHFPTVERFVINNNGSATAARDIFHDSLFILINNLKAGLFRGESSAGTYFFAICKNRWLKEVDNIRKEKLAISEAEELNGHDNDSERMQAKIMALDLLLMRMKPECRQILREFYFSGLSIAELKELHGTKSIDVMKIKKHRCLKYFKRLFIEMVL